MTEITRPRHRRLHRGQRTPQSSRRSATSTTSAAGSPVILATVAADLGSTHALTAGRPGSWEADSSTSSSTARSAGTTTTWSYKAPRRDRQAASCGRRRDERRCPATTQPSLLMTALADQIADRLASRLGPTPRRARRSRPAIRVSTPTGGPRPRRRGRGAEQSSYDDGLWTTRESPSTTDVAVGFVYQHADELGCVRLGGAPAAASVRSRTSSRNGGHRSAAGCRSSSRPPHARHPGPPHGGPKRTAPPRAARLRPRAVTPAGHRLAGSGPVARPARRASLPDQEAQMEKRARGEIRVRERNDGTAQLFSIRFRAEREAPSLSLGTNQRRLDVSQGGAQARGRPRTGASGRLEARGARAAARGSATNVPRVRVALVGGRNGRAAAEHAARLRVAADEAPAAVLRGHGSRRSTSTRSTATARRR